MLQKLRGNSQGFTLIELMIVIAIIGILAAIAIPNFIAYRNKAFCSAAESDANNIAAAIADYFAVPTRTDPPLPDPTAGRPNGLGMTLSGSGTSLNVGDVGQNVQSMLITVTDSSARCPDEYMNSVVGWNTGVYTILM